MQHDEAMTQAQKAAKLAEEDRERLRKERVPDAWWTAREAIERARRQRAGLE